VTDREQATLPVDDESGEGSEAPPAGVEREETADDLPQAAEPAPVEEEPEAEAPPDELSAWANSTGALVLGALPPDEAAAAAREVALSPAMRAEVAALLPVADILMSLYQTQPAPAGEAPVAAPQVTQPAPSRRETRAPVAARPVARPAAARSSPIAGIAPGRLLIGALAVIAVLGVLGALALSDRIATRNDEIAALKRQIAELRQNANASTFPLSPTEDAPADARGTIFYSIADAKVLIDVTGLPELDEDRVYQVWFQRSGSTEWEPGPTFVVNADGDAVQRLAGETPTFIRMAVSEEPAPASTEPSGPFLLEGLLAGSNG
jgi:hypothetical protein